MKLSEKRLSAADAEKAVEDLQSMGCTDGLPVIVPTPNRVERMVLASGIDPDVIIGELGPNMGLATVEKNSGKCRHGRL